METDPQPTSFEAMEVGATGVVSSGRGVRVMLTGGAYAGCYGRVGNYYPDLTGKSVEKVRLTGTDIDETRYECLRVYAKTGPPESPTYHLTDTYYLPDPGVQVIPADFNIPDSQG